MGQEQTDTREKSLLEDLKGWRPWLDALKDQALFGEGDAVARRISYWKNQWQQYARLKNGESPLASQVEQAGDMLKVLDNKFGIMLQFLSLYAVLVGVILKVDPDNSGFNLFEGLFWISWFLTMLILGSLQPSHWLSQRGLK